MKVSVLFCLESKKRSKTEVNIKYPISPKTIEKRIRSIFKRIV